MSPSLAHGQTSDASAAPSLLVADASPSSTAPTAAAQQKKDQRAAEKALKKAQKQAEAGSGAGGKKQQQQPLRFQPREWGMVKGLEKLEVQGNEVSVMTWNMLAQALVRRELFPNSDCLKVKDRIPALMQEVLHYDPDVVCLQEVDRLPDHLPSLTLTHGYTSYIGYPNKSHGLLIAHKNSVFEKVGERGLRLDELPLDESAGPLSSSPSTESSSATSATSTTDESLTHASTYNGAHPDSLLARKRAGLSRSTRNVALFVALKFKEPRAAGEAQGMIVGTTHLFWHPQHVYERVRQTGILMREAEKFRAERGWEGWPCFLAGDFNSQPIEITYRLLMGLPLTSAQEAQLVNSTVVHQSVDLLHNPGWVAPEESEEQKQAVAHSVRSGVVQDPDKVIKNCRAGVEEDGLGDLDALKKLYGYGGGGERARSAYGEVGGLIEGEEGKWYVDRKGEVQSAVAAAEAEEEQPEAVEDRKKGSWDEKVRRGDFEPMWTNFTPLWRLTIDYIFLLPPSTSSNSSTATNGTPHPEPRVPRFTALLKTHATETLGLGLPRLGVEPSDHVSIAAKVEIF